MKVKTHVNNQEKEVSDDMKDIVQQIRKDLEKSDKSTSDSQRTKFNDFSTNNPHRDSAVEFMKRIELMREKEKKPNKSIMSVKSRVIQQTNQDSDGNLSMRIISHVNGVKY